MNFLFDVSQCSDPNGLGAIVSFLKTILTLIQIGIPIGLILLGTIDLGKAVLAGEEKEIKENQQMLFKRAISAVLVFFVTAIVTFAIGLIPSAGSAWSKCWNQTTSVDTVININRA
jgi:hypothetical protein